MRQAVVRRKLMEAQERLEQARIEHAVLAEQVEYFAEQAEEMRIRNLLAETPLSAHEYTEVRRAADTLQRAKAALEAEMAELVGTRERLLERVEVES